MSPLATFFQLLLEGDQGLKRSTGLEDANEVKAIALCHKSCLSSTLLLANSRDFLVSFRVKLSHIRLDYLFECHASLF